jgi:predicted aspartyl protease
MRTRRVACALLALAIPLLAQDSGGYTVPIEFKANVIIATATVNGKPGQLFVVDTGAEKNFLTPQAAQACGSNGAADVDLNGASVKGVEMIIMDPPQMHPLRQYGVNYAGCLGYPFMCNFVVTFDYKNKKLILVPKDKAPKLEADKDRKSWIVPFQLARSVIFLDGKVNGKDQVFLLDSGASESVLFPDSAKALGIRGTPKQSSLGPVEEATVDSINVGGAEVRNVKLAVFNHPATGQLRQVSGRHVDGLLGHSFFEKFLLTLDYRTKEIRLSSLEGSPAPKKGSTPAPKKKKK